MTELFDALTRLRAVARERQAPWGKPVSIDEVRATLRHYETPELDEIVTWYHLCPAGTCPAPYILVHRLGDVAEDYGMARAIASQDFPEDSSRILDWYPLSQVEHGGLVVQTRDIGEPRGLSWRSEIGVLDQDLCFDHGLSALVDLWTEGWLAERYEVRDNETWVAFRDGTEGSLF